MAAIAGEAFELEAMSKEDRSWHPCSIALRSSNASFGLIVDFKDGTKEDIISYREDALARLRPRSTPLRDGECFHIKEGEYVLVMHKAQSRSLFFDAVVMKPYIKKHSNRVYCRCTFEIKWLNPELGKEAKIVSSSSIMKLSNKGINSHPVLDAFLISLNPRNVTEVPLIRSTFVGANYNDDQHELLDRQIEEISKLADELSECSKDILLEVKGVSFSGCATSKAITSYANSLNCQNNSRKSTRSQRKLQMEMDLKKELEEKPLLSPLAARAALAWLVQELPQTPEFSIGRKLPVDLPPRDPDNHIEVQSLDVSRNLESSENSTRDKVSDVLTSVQGIKGYMLEEVSILSVSNQKSDPKKSKANKSPQLPRIKDIAVQSSNESEESKQHISSTNSVSDRQLNGQVITRRLTRSLFQKEQELTDEMKQESCNKKFNSPATTKLTRSTKWKEEISSNIKQGVEKRNISENVQDMSVDDLVFPKKNEKHVKRLISSSADRDMDLALDKKKKTRASSIIANTKEYKVEVLEEKSSRAQKKKSTKKPVLRCSARLRFLPRTRSQKKS